MLDMVSLIKNQEWEQAMVYGNSAYYGDDNDERTWSDLLNRERFDWQTMDSFSWSSIALLIHKHKHDRPRQTHQLIRIVSNSFKSNNFEFSTIKANPMY